MVTKKDEESRGGKVVWNPSHAIGGLSERGLTAHLTPHQQIVKY